jgi:hypothetical protein
VAIEVPGRPIVEREIVVPAASYDLVLDPPPAQPDRG